MRVAETEEATEPVATLKVALLLPPATVTEAGTVAAVLLLESETAMPPVGAGPFNVTVPVADTPLVTLAGETAIDESETPTLDIRGMVTVEFAAMATLS